MNIKLIERIKELNKTIKDLESLPYKSDQDGLKLNDAKHELNYLIDQIDDKKDLRRLDDIIQTSNHTKKPIDKTAQDFIEDESQKPADDIHLSKINLKNLRAKKEHLKRIMQIEKEKDEIIKLEEKLDEYIKEGKYITGKRKKDGTYDIREKKYQARLKELQDKKKSARTSSEKLNATMDILSHKMIKVQKYLNNGMIKTSRGIATVSKQITELGDQLGQMGKYSGFDEGYSLDNPFTESKTTKTSSKRKKSRKKSKKSSRTSSRSPKTPKMSDDFGFNVDNIL